MDRLDTSKSLVRAGKDSLLPKRVSKQPKHNGRQVVIEAKDLYSTKQSPNNTTKGLEQRQQPHVRKTSAPTPTKEEKESKPVASDALFVRRLSQCGVSPGSQEYQHVLKGLMPRKESEDVKPKSQVGKPAKNRKISFNDYGRASGATKRLEDTSLSPRPKRSLDMRTAPTISSINRAVDHRKTENNGKTTQSRRSFPFSNIKEAWQESESSLEASKVDRRRHVSLPAPPSEFYLIGKKQETLVESYKTEKAPRKDTSNSVRSNRKISTVLPPNLHNMTSVTVSTGSPRTATSEGQSDATHRKVSPEFSELESIAKAKFEPESFDSQPRKNSPTLNTELLKIKQISAANGQDLHPNVLLGIKGKQTGNSGELLDHDGEHQAALRARKNFQRIGKAAVAARRFLGIPSRETSGSTNQQHQLGISPLAKNDKPFDQMVEEMKYSYQDLQLGPKDGEEKSN